MKIFAAAAVVATMLTCQVRAEEHGQLPAPTPFAPFPSSFRSGELVFVPPYGTLPVRIYTTPGVGPFYNVPPYKVIAPY